MLLLRTVGGRAGGRAASAASCELQEKRFANASPLAQRQAPRLIHNLRQGHSKDAPLQSTLPPPPSLPHLIVVVCCAPVK
jgi:hypothetical protein